MGLDMIAYRNIKHVENPERDEEGYLVDEDNLFSCYANPHFLGREAPLVHDGAYTRGDVAPETVTTHLGIGYSGWSRMRIALAGMVLGVENPTMGHFDKIRELPHVPLHKLIYFSDCEGDIGSVACAEISEQLNTLEAKAREVLPERYMQVYTKLQSLFAWAAVGGVVRFH